MYWPVVFLLGIVSASVTELTGLNFEREAFGKPGRYSLINFFSNSCQHCYQLSFHYEPLGTLFNNTAVDVFKIDAKTNNRVRKDYKIVGFPTVALFGSDGEIIAHFTQQRTTENLVKFIEKHTGVHANYPESEVVRLAGLDHFTELTTLDKQVVMAVTAPWTEDWNDRHNLFYEKLATYYKQEVRDDGVVFVLVDGTDPLNTDVTSFLRVDRYPTLFLFSPEFAETGDFERLDQSKPHKLGPEEVVALIQHRNVGQVKLNYRNITVNNEEEDDDEGIEGIGRFEEDL